MSLFSSFEKCILNIFEGMEMDGKTLEMDWGHVILFYAKCGIILSEDDFLGIQRSQYLTEIIDQLAKPLQIKDFVSTQRKL